MKRRGHGVTWTPVATIPTTRGPHLVYCGLDRHGNPVYFVADWDAVNGAWRDDEGGLIFTVTHWSEIAPPTEGHEK